MSTQTIVSIPLSSYTVLLTLISARTLRCAIVCVVIPGCQGRTNHVGQTAEGLLGNARYLAQIVEWYAGFFNVDEDWATVMLPGASEAMTTLVGSSTRGIGAPPRLWINGNKEVHGG
jgi:hypothetical protein